MSKNHLLEFYEELDEIEEASALTQTGARTSKKRLSKKREMEAGVFVRAQEISRDVTQFTYKAARFEEAWLLDSIGGLYEYHWISDVLSKVKGGKEASVYLCRAGNAVPDAELVAAKVYRPRTLRNLKNDAQYREGRAELDAEGRVILDDRTLHAVSKRSAYGEEVRHQSWIAYEYTSLQTLYEAGADVPRPFTSANNVILMGYVGEVGMAAPALSEISLERDQARVLFERVVRNLDIMLAHERVHGDLSAYNILFWENEITLIDFPQVVSPKTNHNAYALFVRDVIRVCQYFAKQGVDCDPRRLAHDLWVGRGYPERDDTLRDPRLLDPEDKRDRQLWERVVS